MSSGSPGRRSPSRPPCSNTTSSAATVIGVVDRIGEAGATGLAHAKAQPDAVAALAGSSRPFASGTQSVNGHVRHDSSRSRLHIRCRVPRPGNAAAHRVLDSSATRPSFSTGTSSSSQPPHVESPLPRPGRPRATRRSASSRCRHRSAGSRRRETAARDDAVDNLQLKAPRRAHASRPRSAASPLPAGVPAASPAPGSVAQAAQTSVLHSAGQQFSQQRRPSSHARHRCAPASAACDLGADSRRRCVSTSSAVVNRPRLKRSELCASCRCGRVPQHVRGFAGLSAAHAEPADTREVAQARSRRLSPSTPGT